jgi:hypothetical protein
MKVVVATPVASVIAEAGVRTPYAASFTEKEIRAAGTYCPVERFLATTVIWEESALFAITHALFVAMVDGVSAIVAETVPVMRRSPSRIKKPAFARMSNTLEKYDAFAKYIKLCINKNARFSVKIEK